MLPLGKASAFLGGGNCLAGMAVLQMRFNLTPLYFPGLFAGSGAVKCQVRSFGAVKYHGKGIARQQHLTDFSLDIQKLL